MNSQFGAILALGAVAVYLFVLLQRAVAYRPLYEAECEQAILKMKIAYQESLESHEYAVSGRLEAMRTRLHESERVRDRRDAERDEKLRDIELVLKARGYRLNP